MSTKYNTTRNGKTIALTVSQMTNAELNGFFNAAASDGDTKMLGILRREGARRGITIDGCYR